MRSLRCLCALRFDIYLLQRLLLSLNGQTAQSFCGRTLLLTYAVVVCLSRLDFRLLFWSFPELILDFLFLFGEVLGP